MLVVSQTVPVAAQFTVYNRALVEEEFVGSAGGDRQFADAHSDVVVARLAAVEQSADRTFYREVIRLADGAEVRPVWIEEYDILSSALGRVQGRLRAVWIGHRLANGEPAPLRPRSIGQTVLAAVSLPVGGVLQLGGELDPTEPNPGVLLQIQDSREVFFSRCFEVQGPTSLPTVGTLSERMLSAVIHSLPGLNRTQQIRSLELLSGLMVLGQRELSSDLLSRRLTGVTDDLDARDRWLAYRALRRLGITENLPEALESLRLVATDEAEWAAYPLRGGDDYSWLAYGAERRKGLLGVPERVIDFAADAVDARLAERLVFHSLADRHPDLRQSRVVELWNQRSPPMERALLRHLPDWSGMTAKRLQRDFDHRGQYLNYAKLVDFWTAWLGG